MADIFADDLFEIYGSHIQVSTITDYRLGQIEYIKRPLYFERGKSKWGSLFSGNAHKIEFGKMDYYAAIIGETKYKNAIEESVPLNLIDATLKAVASGVSNVIADLQKNRIAKSIKYRMMNASWRVFERTLEEIPAALYREDGKVSEVFRKDELYPLLGEPIAPQIEMIPALYINTTNGKYVFFGNGIQVQNIQSEYERLKMAIQAIKSIKEQPAKKPDLLQGILGVKLPPPPKISIPFLTPTERPQTNELPGPKDHDE